jgi:hypothetical protein
MNVPWLGFLLLNSLDSRNLQKDSKILHLGKNIKTRRKLQDGMQNESQPEAAILREPETKSTTRPLSVIKYMKIRNLPLADAILGKTVTV